MNSLHEYIKKTGRKPTTMARAMGVAPSTVYRHLKIIDHDMTLRMAKKYHDAGIPWEVLHKFIEDKG
jgi:plasmid maintenance system antidote protein VapI